MPVTRKAFEIFVSDIKQEMPGFFVRPDPIMACFGLSLWAGYLAELTPLTPIPAVVIYVANQIFCASWETNDAGVISLEELYLK